MVRRPQELFLLPHLAILEHSLLGQVGRVALRCAGVDPRDEGGDVGVRKAPIVLDLLNAHSSIDVIRRHQPP